MRQRRAAPAAACLPAYSVGLLVLATIAAGTDGDLGAVALVVLVATLTALVALVAELSAVPAMVVLGWLTITGFSRAPYAELQTTPDRAGLDAVALLVAGLFGLCVGVLGRATSRTRSTAGSLPAPRATLEDMPLPEPDVSVDGRSAAALVGARIADLGRAVDRGRQLTGVALALVLLPSLTAALLALGTPAQLDDDLMVFLVAVLAVTLVGGFWPALAASVAASLLLNWYFTPPVHTLTIDSPQHLLALLLFVAVAVSVSGVVHLAARRAAQARRAESEAAALGALARSVLGGEDSARDVLTRLAADVDGHADLLERVGSRWTTVATSGPAGDTDGRGVFEVVSVRDDVRLDVRTTRPGLSPSLLEGYAAQAVAALDRERLRDQAAQAEVLAAGNRMRTALLTAVSHDLRTPLSSVKAGVSSLRQTDVAWTDADREALLETVEEGADRLDHLIADLLDMSRIHTGVLEPMLRPIAVDDLVASALRTVASAAVVVDLPDPPPVVVTDPGLLERAVANLVANATRFAPAGSPVVVRARLIGDDAVVDVVDQGPGVPAAMRQQMFEPFQQLGDRKTGGGVGLGLAVARGVVEATGGELSAHTTPGGGLTMRIRLRRDRDRSALPVQP